ncbi:MAG: carbamoyltransferase HypF [SAR324 cluster bacterium]
MLNEPVSIDPARPDPLPEPGLCPVQAAPEEVRRVRIAVQGTVQGVGFRPFVHRLAAELGLGGWVLNGADGVTIEVEGPGCSTSAFVARLSAELPPLAHIERMAAMPVAALGERIFRIAPSERAERPFTLIAPDIATCPDCLAELQDPDNRRFSYAFINCTNCGPRFTVVRDLPYDRANTTMDVFPLCPTCLVEYEHPADRRFHAEPTACPKCGPALTFSRTLARGANSTVSSPQQPLQGNDPIGSVVASLRAGQIVAIKGLGGFHLACDARNGSAVALLRQRKGREEKPFAVMVAGLAQARELCAVSRDEAALLSAPERPIVLLDRRRSSREPLAAAVAPGQKQLGLMLPYTPLHSLLLGRWQGPLVMTSGNLSEEPIAYRNDEAQARLGSIADGFLLHNRDIHMRCDDSVARVWGGAARLLRRSRGYAPAPVRLRWRFSRPILAVGGELKNTFCLGRENFAILSHHIGDLENEAAMRAFEGAVEHYCRLFQVAPEVIVHDLHPDYRSTRFALEQAGRARIVGVQHHHAHVAAVMAEHGLEGPVIGLAWDGTGYGTDGCLWGGEFLVCDLRGFERVGHWSEFPLPGGAAAIRQPWRVAAGLLRERFGDDVAGLPLPALLHHASEIPVLSRMIERRINVPRSCGVGRLFDAAAALIAGQETASYEGQAAQALEQLADGSATATCPVELAQVHGQWIPDSASLLASVARRILEGTAPQAVAAGFHAALALAGAEVCRQVRAQRGIRQVVLGGGVFQNRVLLQRCSEALTRSGLDVYVSRQVPTNDGGLALGQVVVGDRLTCV